MSGCKWTVPVDYIELILGCVIYFMFIGGWWFTVFEKQFVEATKMKEKFTPVEMNFKKSFLCEFGSRILQIVGYYHLLGWFAPETLCEHLILSFWVSLTYFTLPRFQGVLWEYKPPVYITIGALERILSLACTTIFFYQWRNYYNPDTQTIGGV